MMLSSRLHILIQNNNNNLYEVLLQNQRIKIPKFDPQSQVYNYKDLG